MLITSSLPWPPQTSTDGPRWRRAKLTIGKNEILAWNWAFKLVYLDLYGEPGQNLQKDLNIPIADILSIALLCMRWNLHKMISKYFTWLGYFLYILWHSEPIEHMMWSVMLVSVSIDPNKRDIAVQFMRAILRTSKKCWGGGGGHSTQPGAPKYLFIASY